MTEHRGLVAITVDFMDGLILLKKAITLLQDSAEVLALSSIYKRYTSDLKNDLNAQLWIVLKISTELGAEELLSESALIEVKCSEKPEHHKTKIYLLALDDEVLLTPQLTLPHPELHSVTLFTVGSAEVWGQYVHPILKRTLNELSKGQGRDPMIEFLGQGTRLLAV